MDKVRCKLRISITDQVRLDPDSTKVRAKYPQQVVCEIDDPTGAYRLVAVFSTTSDGAIDRWQLVDGTWVSKPISVTAATNKKHTQDVRVLVVALGPDAKGEIQNLFGWALQPILRDAKIGGDWDEAHSQPDP